MVAWTEMGRAAKEKLRSQGEADKNGKMLSSAPLGLLETFNHVWIKVFWSSVAAKTKCYKLGSFRKKMASSQWWSTDRHARPAAGLTSEDVYSWLEVRDFTSLSSHSPLPVPICDLVFSYKNSIHIGPCGPCTRPDLSSVTSFKTLPPNIITVLRVWEFDLQYTIWGEKDTIHPVTEINTGSRFGRGGL